jgi:hypothetical protein
LAEARKLMEELRGKFASMLDVVLVSSIARG